MIFATQPRKRNKHIMNIIKLKLDDTRRANLAVLADFLAHNVEEDKFNMKFYFRGGTSEVVTNLRKYHECGTTACAAGYGPLAGIKPLPNETWHVYVSRVFTDQDSIIFNWCFAISWADVDNTPKGAAKRIELFLRNEGVPDNYYEQCNGEAELTY